MERQRCYIAIDLKSFYASVECVERGLDPLDACLVVADKSRTEKTICLAVSPALKAYGLGGRPRLFEVVSKVREINRRRGRRGTSTLGSRLAADRTLSVDYIIARPRMGLYIAYSARIYDIYLRFVAPEDIFAYSVDEVFIDATEYLESCRLTPHDFAMKMIRAVLAETGITATAGIGTNMYLSKVAMDIVAKNMQADADGVRIASLDEHTYRTTLWDHRPLTDFWRVGRGVASRLAPYGIATMGDIALCSVEHEELLYRLFGVNAELLIDHAWGWEPVTMEAVRCYRPRESSLSNGQVLTEPYTFDKARVVALEMIDALSLKLVDKHLLTDQILLEVGYDVESLLNPDIAERYNGRITVDRYGRHVPSHAHGTVNFDDPTSSTNALIRRVAELYDRIVNRDLLIRRLTLSANHLVDADIRRPKVVRQLDLFCDYDELRRRRNVEQAELKKEYRRQQAILRIKKQFGKNAILKGLNFAEGATQRDRNRQIGGHRE